MRFVSRWSIGIGKSFRRESQGEGGEGDGLALCMEQNSVRNSMSARYSYLAHMYGI